MLAQENITNNKGKIIIQKNHLFSQCDAHTASIHQGPIVKGTTVRKLEGCHSSLFHPKVFPGRNAVSMVGFFPPRSWVPPGVSLSLSPHCLPQRQWQRCPVPSPDSQRAGVCWAQPARGGSTWPCRVSQGEGSYRATA